MSGFGAPGVGPDQAVQARCPFDDAAHEHIVWIEDKALIGPVRSHLRDKAIAVDANVEERRVAHVHVTIHDHRSRVFPTTS